MEELKTIDVVMSDPFASENNFNCLMRVAETFAQSSIVPQQYQNNPADCMIAVDLANRMHLNPLFVMQQLSVVKGKPSWSGQACMSMIRASTEFKDVKPVYTGEKGTNTWGCYIQATRRSTGEVVNGPEVTIGIAKAEGWFSRLDRSGNETSKWRTMPELMLAYRASAFFARVHIPNTLMGFAVEGEAEDIARPDPEDAYAPDVFVEAECHDPDA